MISERIKSLHYKNIWTNKYFWRTHDQQEIDYIEERDGIIYGYEFKWNPKKTVRFSKTFLNAYPNSITKVISKDNYYDFLVI